MYCDDKTVQAFHTFLFFSNGMYIVLYTILKENSFFLF